MARIAFWQARSIPGEYKPSHMEKIINIISDQVEDILSDFSKIELYYYEKNAFFGLGN